mgnify:CR=1 FL=1|tara:strand:- start:14577 stop:14912 length:336 start_codon:yes stop_codon:yes gene_type:complete
MKFLYVLLILPQLLNGADLVNKTCISPSGKSIYDISLSNEINSIGQIILRYNNQITHYSAIVKRNNNDKLVGVSKFVKSETGQIQADPWVFTYDYKKNILIDDGRLISSCD